MSIERITPTKPFSSLDIAWTEWSDAPRFALRYRHLSRAAMGDDYRVGVAIEELAPGKRSSPAHYHIFEEEHVYLLEGALTVRIGADTYEMKAGDYVCFPGRAEGWALPHQQRRRDLPLRDRGRAQSERGGGLYRLQKVLVRALGRRAIFDLAATRGYWDGEDTGLPKSEVPPADLEGIASEEPVKPKPPISSHDLAWHEKRLAPGFVDRNKHLTYAAVGEDYHVGILIEGPPPGMRLAPRHYHMLEEEHALILEGQLTLLLGDERYEMKAGDYVCFPAGRKIGHSFLNSGTGPCSYLMIGERNPADVCVMPDSNKMEVRALRAKGSIFDMSGVRNDLDGEQAG